MSGTDRTRTAVATAAAIRADPTAMMPTLRIGGSSHRQAVRVQFSQRRLTALRTPVLLRTREMHVRLTRIRASVGERRDRCLERHRGQRNLTVTPTVPRRGRLTASPEFPTPGSTGLSRSVSAGAGGLSK